ncbi:hypothetical protein Dimus_018964 [Dionaea muscipula]
MNGACITTTIFTHPCHVKATSLLRRGAGARTIFHITATRRSLFVPSPPNLSGQHSRFCHLTQALRSDFRGLTKGVGVGVGDASTQEEVKNILRLAERASMWREVIYTNFLTPPILMESMMALEKFSDVKVVAHGGYPQAERCRLSFSHPDVLVNPSDVVAAFSITGNFGFKPCSHGDFLGSILGTGITREKLGDLILKGEKGAQVLIVPELLDFVTSSLDQVATVYVSCTKIPLDAIEYEPPRTKTFISIEASLRVDAVASAGFKISRSKLSDMISKGDVRVNWKTITKNGTILKTGDMISVTGKGRLKIGEIDSTKKGKYAIELILYL